MSIGDYSDLYQVAAQKYGVPAQLLMAQGDVESSGDPKAYNADTGASGLAQLIPATAKSLGVNDPTDPAQAIDAQARLMAENLKRYGSVDKAVSAYHGGTDTANWGPKTQAYTQKVLGNYQQMASNNVQATDATVDDSGNDSIFAQARKADATAAPTAANNDTSSIFAQARNHDAAVAAIPSQKVDGGVAEAQAMTDLYKGMGHGLMAMPNAVEKGVLYLMNKSGNPLASDAQKYQSNRLAAFNTDGNTAQNVGNVIGTTASAAPAAVLGGEVLGGALGAGSGLITRASPKLAQLAGENPLIGRYLGSVVAGAGAGGAGSASVGADPVKGAEYGAALGPVGQAAGDLVGSMVSESPKVSPLTNKLVQNLSRDGIAPEEVSNQLTALGPNGTVADLGENTKGMMRALSMQPGESRNAVVDFMEQRAAGRPERVLQASTEGLGIKPEGSFDDTVEQLNEQRAEKAAPLYQQAFSANKSIDSSGINAVLETPAGKTALRSAATKMQNDMSNVGTSDPELVEQAKLAGSYEPGQGGIASGLNLRTLDYVKRSLDDQIGAAQRTGENDNVRVLTGLKNKLVTELDSADSTASAGPNSTKPEGGLYKQARQGYAGDSQGIKATELGRSIVKNGAVDPYALSKISEADKPFVRVGIAHGINDMIANTSDGRDVITKLFGSPAKRKLLSEAFPSQEAFQKFADTMEREKLFAGTEKSILQGSRTTPAAMEANDLTSPSKLSGVGTLVKHGGELAQRNAAGKAIYLSKMGLNKLVQPKGIDAEDASNIANLMLNKSGSVNPNWYKNRLANDVFQPSAPRINFGIPATTITQEQPNNQLQGNP